MLEFICDEIDASCSNDTNHPYYSRPIFEAVRQDAYKVVQQILSRSYNLIDFKNQQGHNIIQLAVINRSEKVYNLFYPIIKRTESYSTMTDSSMNNLVHLAGRLAPSYVLSRTPLPQVQHCNYSVSSNGVRSRWILQEVEKLMLPTHLLKENIYMETPEMETGIPLFRKEIAFTIFAVADAISLFSAATSLLVFLSIITTHFSKKDFRESLPRRLIIGLCVLFISATAIMVAFCTALYLVFCDQRPWMLAPIGGLACLPIAVIATLQFPLVVDLFISTSFPIFQKDKFDFVESEILLRMDEE
ncbi:Ankyrin repeat-containing protein [Artemisia annua]|uniref:Ankyrin repeat-containing protein n=1 Tax=Artemisia annua TaxID=35608 RepID=A0A2U1LD83_ARTAN|nr:Ankyrin repeat-containing protein [Artemisia annua]